MKTKILCVIAFVAILNLIPGNIFAQERLNAVVKKCEMMDNVDMNIIQQRDKKTKEVTQTLKSITVKNNKTLVDEILNAFAQDKKDSYNTIENNHYGKMLPSLYQFSDGKMNLTYTFALTDANGTGATLTLIQRPEDDEND